MAVCEASTYLYIHITAFLQQGEEPKKGFAHFHSVSEAELGFAFAIFALFINSRTNNFERRFKVCKVRIFYFWNRYEYIDFSQSLSVVFSNGIILLMILVSFFEPMP